MTGGSFRDEDIAFEADEAGESLSCGEIRQVEG